MRLVLLCCRNLRDQPAPAERGNRNCPARAVAHRAAQFPGRRTQMRRRRYVRQQRDTRNTHLHALSRAGPSTMRRRFPGFPATTEKSVVGRGGPPPHPVACWSPPVSWSVTRSGTKTLHAPGSRPTDGQGGGWRRDGPGHDRSRRCPPMPARCRPSPRRPCWPGGRLARQGRRPGFHPPLRRKEPGSASRAGQKRGR